MRLPDIPHRHRRLVRTAAAVGTGALALVRRRDVAAENEPILRLGTALADTGLTWITGTRAFLGQTAGSTGIDDVLEAFTLRGSGAVRYATEERSSAHSSDPDAWWDEQASVKSPAFFNAVTAVAAGAASWAAWPLTQRIAEAVDDRLPTGVSRGLGAVASGGLVALTGVLIDMVERWSDREYEEVNYAPVEIELPAHIRKAVDLLLAQPHPVSEHTAEAVREQFASAQFFVWVTYPDSLHSGDEPVVLDQQQLHELLEEQHTGWIDVRPRAESQKAVPAMQTYPVIGFTGTDPKNGLTLTLDIIDGHLSRLDLAEPEEEAIDELLTAEVLRDSVPGTLHPDGSGEAAYWSTFEITDAEEAEEIDELITLQRWPRSEEMNVRIDGE